MTTKTKKATRKFLQKKAKTEGTKKEKKRIKKRKLSENIIERKKVLRNKDKARDHVKDIENEKKKSADAEKANKEKKSLVDDLLQADFFDHSSDEDDNDEEKEENEDDDEEMNDDAVEDFEDQDEYDAKAHESELAGIKDSDPEFFKFLQENDPGLLDFTAGEDEVDESDDEDDDEAKEKSEKKKQDSVLSMERFEKLSASALEKKSFHAFRVLFAAFRSSVQLAANHVSVTEKPINTKRKGVEGAKDQKKRLANQKKQLAEQAQRQSKALFSITDEEVMSKVIEWICVNASTLLDHHLGPRLKTKEKTHSLDITAFTNGRKCGRLGRAFWSETLYLLRHGQMDLKQMVLETACSEQMQRFLWPFAKLRLSVYKEVGLLWSTAPRHQIRLLAFLFLRNAVAFPAHVARHDGTDAEEIVKLTCKMFAHATERGYTWRSVNGFQFMEQGLLELMKVDENMAYRIAYTYIRQLAVILRNSTHTSTIKKETEKEKKVQLLYSWSFIRSIYLWTHLIINMKNLEPLSYPLYMIITGALKSQIMNLHYYPYTFHCLRCLCKLGTMGKFVPISSFVLRLLTQVSNKFNKINKNTRGEKNKDKMGKTSDVEVLLKFSDQQLDNKQTIEHIASQTMLLLGDHLGVIARTPSFPELIPIILMHLRKITKNLHSETLRRDIKTIITASESSATFIKGARENLEFDGDKFLIFGEEKVQMAQIRKQLLNKRKRELTQKLISMTEESDKKPKYNDFEDENIDATVTTEGDETPRELSKRAIKRQRQKLKKLEEMKEKEGRAAKAAEHKETAHATEDVVEAMTFSDSDGEVDLPKPTITAEPTETKMKNQTFKTKKKHKKDKEQVEEKVDEPMKKKKNKGQADEQTTIPNVSSKAVEESPAPQGKKRQEPATESEDQPMKKKKKKKKNVEKENDEAVEQEA